MRFTARLSAVLLAGILSLSLATAGFAQKGKKAGPQGIPQAWMARLNLNADQSAKVKTASDTLEADLASAKSLTGKEKRQATRAANDKFTAAVSTALNDDQKKQLDAMRAEAAEFQGMGPAGNQMVGLNLTADQKTKIKEITGKYQPELDKLRAEQKNATDKKAGRQAMQEVNQKMMGEIRLVLNDDQKKQLAPAGGKKKKKNKKNL